jgi:AraC-like DNA-binding protein
MGNTLVERLTNTPEGMMAFQQERTIQALTDLICEIMEDQGVSRADLARRLNRTKGYITQLLDGHANMTIRTVSDVFAALGRAVTFRDESLRPAVPQKPLLETTAVWSDYPEWKMHEAVGCLPTCANKHRMAS